MSGYTTDDLKLLGAILRQAAADLTRNPNNVVLDYVAICAVCGKELQGRAACDSCTLDGLRAFARGLP